MCEYVYKKELKQPKQIILRWLRKTQKDLKKTIRFSVEPVGSGKRNMVVRKCNIDYFDLDFQLIITRWDEKIDINDAKKIKKLFENAFNINKPNDFSFCEDSTQALQSKNNNGKYGFDIVITKYDENHNMRILHNNKNSNNANNYDYEWQPRKDFTLFRENFKKISGSEEVNYLRKIYLDKRHKFKDNNKKSYQILNEAVNETLVHFKKVL